MKCKVTDCNDTNLVYSGIDAMLLGVPTESVCYTHATQYALVSEVIA